MSRKDNIRKREARKRRTNSERWKIQIPNQLPPRTLKRSARKQLERERAPWLRIYPWIADRDWRLGGRNYPHASLLGLSTELRQHILYVCMDIEDLERTVRQVEAAQQEEQSARDEGQRVGVAEPSTIKTGMGKEKLVRLSRNLMEGKLLTVLERRVGELSCVSPLVRQDMKYVRQLWDRDLKEHRNRQFRFRFDGSKLRTFDAGYDWRLNDEIKASAWTRKKGMEIEGLNHKKLREKYRPYKCWYCTERHWDGDPMCPMARRDPKRWEKLTKKVGGRRSSVRLRPTFQGTRVVFEDD